MRVCACVCVCERERERERENREHLTNLRVQGQLFHMDSDLSYWSVAISPLPDRDMRLAYIATIYTLITNASLALWYKCQVCAQCKLFGFPTQTLKLHVYQRRFDSRHDSVLSVIYNFIVNHIQGSHVLADLPGQSYCFPVHIAATDK